MGKGFVGAVLGTVAAGTAIEYAVAHYFFRRTMIRSNAKRDRTQDMSGTDWNNYIPQIHKDKEWLAERGLEDVYISSDDGLRLHGSFVSCGNSKNVVICFHGYTSEGLNDYSSLAKFYYEQGFNLLIVDERAHGKSEGKYIGFGCLDRHDALNWIEYTIKRIGDECNILLQGDSMGASTVLMTTGLELPSQVKAAVSDCAFTSAWDVFSSVLKNMYHIPPFPIMQIANRMVVREAGYGLNECDARKEVAKSHIPILFIHGDSDSFVPCSMVYELYDSCSSPKELLVVKGAGHVEAYYKNPDEYEEAVKKFIIPKFKEE